MPSRCSEPCEYPQVSFGGSSAPAHLSAHPIASYGGWGALGVFQLTYTALPLPYVLPNHSVTLPPGEVTETPASRRGPREQRLHLPTMER